MPIGPNPISTKATKATEAISAAPANARGLTSVTDEDRALYEMPPISSYLPLRFTNGAQLLEFSGNCGGCRRPIPAANFRGHVNQAFPRVVIIAAVGACNECRLFSRFNYRVHDDLSTTGIRDGVWRRWEARREKDGGLLWGQPISGIFRLIGRALRWLFTPPSR